jgi:protein-S-isoprenylcysteine O-methyltransferase Ste14
MASIRTSIAVSALFTIFGGPGILLVYVPYALTRSRIPANEPMGQMMLAGSMIVIGLIPLFDSMGRFIFAGRGTLVPTAPTERLVVSGLYRYVRNPMYVGVLTVLAGEAILLWSADLLMDWMICALGIHLFVVFYEEPTLMRRHPQDYPRYKDHVPRWLPRLTPWVVTGDDAKS